MCWTESATGKTRVIRGFTGCSVAQYRRRRAVCREGVSAVASGSRHRPFARLQVWRRDAAKTAAGMAALLSGAYMSGGVIEIVRTTGKEDEVPTVVGRAVYEHPYIVRLCHWINTVALFVMVGSGLADFSRLPQLRRQDSAERLAALAEGVRHRRLAGRSVAVAPHLHVDLHRDRRALSRLPDLQR